MCTVKKSNLIKCLILKTKKDFSKIPTEWIPRSAIKKWWKFGENWRIFLFQTVKGSQQSCTLADFCFTCLVIIVVIVIIVYNLFGSGRQQNNLSSWSCCVQPTESSYRQLVPASPSRYKSALTDILRQTTKLKLLRSYVGTGSRAVDPHSFFCGSGSWSSCFFNADPDPVHLDNPYEKFSLVEK